MKSLSEDGEFVPLTPRELEIFWLCWFKGRKMIAARSWVSLWVAGGSDPKAK